MEQCINGVDEVQCDDEETKDWNSKNWHLADSVEHDVCFPPILVKFDNSSIHICNFTKSEMFRSCPNTHFRCPGDLICLPVYVRCNEVYDCPGHEDEAECSRYSVPGFYRCRASRIHLYVSHMCDGYSQCPQKDDELFCNWTCPNNCTCYGSAFFCDSSFSVHEYGELRFLEGRGSGMKPADFASNTMLIHLGLASCGQTHLSLPMLHNLHSLDLSNNHLHALNADTLLSVERLSTLSMSGNPLSLQSPALHQPVPSVLTLDLSDIYLPVLSVNLSATFPNVQKINLSQSGVHTVNQGFFQETEHLQVLDLSGCSVNQFPYDLFNGLKHLEVVHSENYKLCCSVILPKGINPRNCHAPSDEVSSCDALLRSNVYRMLLAFFAVSSLLGNLLSFIFRIRHKRSSTSGFSVFVTHLCVSDFLMGVYLAVIGTADSVYGGSYLWQDEHWKHSILCQVAGVLSLLSSEVSAFIICLITLDRFLVLQFPFSQIHFSQRSALMACGMVWCGGLTLAVVPLMPGLSHWQYYSQTGICIPLPITRKTFGGHKYSFGIIIILNFGLFLLTALGQLVIYWSIRTNTMCSSDAVVNRKNKDLTIARRLFTVATSDFLCWFPVGLLGLQASQGVAVPGEANVAMAIIVLPLNSTLNPFLYTFNLIRERRRHAKELRLVKRYMLCEHGQSSCQSSSTTKVDKLKLSFTKQEISLLLERWLHSSLLCREQIKSFLKK